MKKIIINKNEEFLKSLRTLFSLDSITGYLYENTIGLLIILSHIKAKEWPWRGKELNNDPVACIPFLFGICYSDNKDELKILYDIHPCKCLPLQYNKYNSNTEKTPLIIDENSLGTLGGCARYQVKVNDRFYNIYNKIPLYCQIFGIPDDCFSPSFENLMIKVLENCKKNLDLWCFEKTEYISDHILPILDLKFIKGNLLPSKYYPFVSSSSDFLRGIFKIKDLDILNSEPWYSYTYELVEEFNPFESEDYFRYEEKALYFIKKKLLYESIRQLLLLTNRAELKQFNIDGTPYVAIEDLEDFDKEIEVIIQDIISKTKAELNLFINTNKKLFDFNRFKKARFLVLDIEYIHISYPNGNIKRTFNFPSIVVSIIWKGIRNGFDIEINLFTLPCHFCKNSCKFFKKKIFKFECLGFAFDFFQKQIDLMRELLAAYNGFKLYSYGKSDFFQLEQLANFFTDSFDITEFEMKNRVKTRKLIEISEDLAIDGTSLKEVEENILSTKFPGWSRKHNKESFNKRFMSDYESSKWEENYTKILEACVDDAISALLLLIQKKF